MRPRPPLTRTVSETPSVVITPAVNQLAHNDQPVSIGDPAHQTPARQRPGTASAQAAASHLACPVNLSRTGTPTVTQEVGMSATVGYARCSTTSQDLTAQRQQLAALGVPADRV